MNTNGAPTLPRPRVLRALRPRRAQRGVATLLVVMVLFFVMTMVAAYTSRNIVFEQRISNNLFQATVSSEAAEAGMEWAMGMLNGSLIDNQCVPVENLASPVPAVNETFRNRYLTINPTSGMITVANTVRDGPTWPSCVLMPDGTWQCSCPTAGAGPVIAAPAGPALAPAFRVRFVQVREPTPANPSVVRIEVNGCTTAEDACLNFKPADPNFCRGLICSTVALAGGLKTLPTAAITTRGDFNLGGAAAIVANGQVGTTGLTIVSGGNINTAGLTLQGPAGIAPASTTLANDPGLSNIRFTADRMFAAFFGIWPATFAEQPSTVTLNCAATCTATSVRNAAQLYPGHPLLLLGNLQLDGGAPVGSVTAPVLIVATGNITFSAPTDVYGLVYSQSANWVTGGAGRVFGAAIAQTDMTGGGTFLVSYDPQVLNVLRWTTGSFVRVPGSWADFQ